MPRVLVVDDRLDVRMSLEAILEFAGYELVSAENGRVALDVLNRDMSENKKFDLVITDVMMPELDGIELMTAIRVGYSDKSPPIMVISGGGYNMAADDLLEAANRMADHVLRKPFTAEELIEAVEYLLKKDKPATGET